MSKEELVEKVAIEKKAKEEREKKKRGVGGRNDCT